MGKLKWTMLVLLNTFLSLMIFAQDRTINGRVTDARSLPVAGVNIMVTQTNKGTTTDVDGKFTIVAPEKQPALS